MSEDNSEIKKNNEQLLPRCSQHPDRFHAQETHSVQFEQYSRKKNIDIKSVPTTVNENLLSILGKLGEQIVVPITPDDVDITHRVPVPNIQQMKTLSCSLCTEQSEMSSCRTRVNRKIMTKDLNFLGVNPVFVNKHLCPELKMILKQAVLKNKEANWKYVGAKGNGSRSKNSERFGIKNQLHGRPG